MGVAMRSCTRSCPDTAFSLVELLVVVAIIAVLAGLLVPALTLVRQRAASLACAANLRQCALAAMGYMADHDRFYPMASDPVLGIWQIELGPYFTADDAANGRGSYAKASFCPTYVLPTGTWMDSGQTGLGMNDKLRIEQTWDSSYCWGHWDWFNTAFPAAAVTLPSGRILFGDSGFSILAARNIGSWAWADAAGTAAGSPGDWSWTCDPTRHGRTSNYAFCDGHVETLAPARALVGVTDPARF